MHNMREMNRWRATDDTSSRMSIFGVELSPYPLLADLPLHTSLPAPLTTNTLEGVYACSELASEPINCDRLDSYSVSAPTRDQYVTH